MLGNYSVVSEIPMSDVTALKFNLVIIISKSKLSSNNGCHCWMSASCVVWCGVKERGAPSPSDY